MADALNPLSVTIGATGGTFAPIAVHATLTEINRHAFEDYSVAVTTGTNLGYASYDANAKMNNSGTEDHFVGFQSRNDAIGSGSITRYDAFNSTPKHYGSGTIETLIGLRANDAVGPGPINVQYGIYVAPQTKGAVRYGIAVGGTNVNYFGGTVGIGAVPSQTSPHKLEVTGSFRLAGELVLNEISNLSAGNYTPTLYNTTNVAASVSAECGYMRVGSSVTVFGSVAVDPIASSTLTAFSMSLPIASDMTASSDMGGAGCTPSLADVWAIAPDTANNLATFTILSVTGLASRNVNFSFSYRVK